MNTENTEPQLLLPEKPEPPEQRSSLLRTLISLLLFIAVDYMIFKSWLAVLLLVGVILIHEMGHFIAMKAFGYTGVNMTFVPFVGAYVSGETSNFSKRNKIIMLLAGPLPGIVIGLVLFFLYRQGGSFVYFQASLLFLLLNVFNLVPVSPLDGGQFFETMFLSGGKKIQLWFLYISLAAVLFVVIRWELWSLILIAIFIFLRIQSTGFSNRIQMKLAENGIDYNKTYNELTDEEYWKIRNVVIENSKTLRSRFTPEVPSDKEFELIGLVKNCLVPPYNTALSIAEKIVFLTLWFAGIAVPVLTWLIYKGSI